MSESLNVNSEKSAEDMRGDGSWGDEYQKSVPPFNPDQKKEEPDDSSLETSQGQVKFLGDYLSSEKTEYERALRSGESDFESVKSRLAEIDYQTKLLDSVRGEVTDGGDLVEILKRKFDEIYQVYRKDADEQGQNYKGGDSWNEMHYAQELCKTLADQLTRDPQTAPYVSLDEVERLSESAIRQATETARRKRVQLDNLNNMGNSEVDDKGIAHIYNYREDGTPVEHTVDLNAVKEEIENAEIDAAEATAEKWVWRDLLMGASSPMAEPLDRIVKKTDLKPDVIGYIDERSARIEQLQADSKNLEKGTPEYQENEAERRRLAKERSAARRILAKFFGGEQDSAQGESQEMESGVQIDMVSTMDQMEAEIAVFEKNLGKVEEEKQRRLDWEKRHYGYVEGEGRAPMSVLAAEQDMEKISTLISQKDKDIRLLYRVYKESGKSRMLSKADAQAIISRIKQERDAKMATIDKELEGVEKQSERWKQLKREKIETYRSASDEAIERVLGLFSKD